MGYLDGAYAASPCCAPANMSRRQRLQRGETKRLFHQTTLLVAEQIFHAGGKLQRGAFGVAGGGIYFAESARETVWKCEPKDESRRVVLECEVKLGCVKTLGRHGTATRLSQISYKMVLTLC